MFAYFKKYLRSADIALILCLLIIPLIMLIWNVRVQAQAAKQTAAAAVKVSVDGELFGVFALEEDRVVDIYGSNTLTIENGQARMTHADCPDQVCVHTGAIDAQHGGVIVCLPNYVVIEVLRGNENSAQEIDAVAS